MVIGNLDRKRIAFAPGKADPVSVVNPDAVLSFAFLRQQFQVVAGDCGQIAQARCTVQMDQFAQGNLLDGLKFPATESRKDGLRFRIPKRANHGFIVYR